MSLVPDLRSCSSNITLTWPTKIHVAHWKRLCHLSLWLIVKVYCRSCLVTSLGYHRICVCCFWRSTLPHGCLRLCCQTRSESFQSMVRHCSSIQHDVSLTCRWDFDSKRTSRYSFLHWPAQTEASPNSTLVRRSLCNEFSWEGRMGREVSVWWGWQVVTCFFFKQIFLDSLS